MNFLENSPIWDQWGVSGKQVILTSTHKFGNAGAMQVLGGASFALVGLEALLLLIFPALRLLSGEPTASDALSSSGSGILKEARVMIVVFTVITTIKKGCCLLFCCCFNGCLLLFPF